MYVLQIISIIEDKLLRTPTDDNSIITIDSIKFLVQHYITTITIGGNQQTLCRFHSTHPMSELGRV